MTPPPTPPRLDLLHLVDGVWAKLISRASMVLAGALLTWVASEAPGVIRGVASIADKLAALSSRLDGEARAVALEMRLHEQRLESHERRIDDAGRAVDDHEKRLDRLERAAPR